jgi:hypothetical protein
VLECPEPIICSRLHGLYFHVLYFLFFFYFYRPLTPLAITLTVPTGWNHPRKGNLTYSSTAFNITACTSSYMTSQSRSRSSSLLLRPISVFPKLEPHMPCEIRHERDPTAQHEVSIPVNVSPLGTALGRSSPFSGGLTWKVLGRDTHSH